MESLPLELYEKVLLYLDICSINTLSCTSKHFKNVVESCPIVWKVILHRIIPGCDLSKHEKSLQVKRLIETSQSIPDCPQVRKRRRTSNFMTSSSFNLTLNSSVMKDNNPSIGKKRARSVYEKETIIIKHTPIDALKALASITCKQCLNIMSYHGPSIECRTCLNDPDQLVMTRAEVIKNFGLLKFNELTPVSRSPIRYLFKDILMALHQHKKGGIVSFAEQRNALRIKKEKEEKGKEERRNILKQALLPYGITNFYTLESISFVNFGVNFEECLELEIQEHDIREIEKVKRKEKRFFMEKELEESLIKLNLEKYKNFFLLGSYLDGNTDLQQFVSIVKRIEFFTNIEDLDFQRKLLESCENCNMGIPWEEAIQSTESKILRKVESCYYVCIHHVEYMLSERLGNLVELWKFSQIHQPPHEVVLDLEQLIAKKISKSEIMRHQSNRKQAIIGYLESKGMSQDEFMKDEIILKIIKGRGANFLSSIDQYLERKELFESLIQNINYPRIYFDMNDRIRFYLETGLTIIDQETILELKQTMDSRIEFVRNELQRFNILIASGTLENPFIAEYISNGGYIDRSILNYASGLPYKKPKCAGCFRIPGKGCSKGMCSSCCEEDTFKTLHFCSLHVRLFLT